MSTDLELVEHQILTGCTFGGAAGFADPIMPLRRILLVIAGRVEIAIKVVPT
jgi:hypothetical protein